MDTSKLTTKSRDAVSAALRTALTEGNPYAEPSHLLHALLQMPGNTVAPLIAAAGADPTVVAAAAQGAIAKLPSAKGTSVSQPCSQARPRTRSGNVTGATSEIRSVAGTSSGSALSAATIGEAAGRRSSGLPSRSVVCAGTGA